MFIPLLQDIPCIHIVETTSSPTNKNENKSLRWAIASNMARSVTETANSFIILGLLRSLWRLLRLFRFSLGFHDLFWSTLPTYEPNASQSLFLFRCHLLGAILRHMSGLTAIETSTGTAETTASRDKMFLPIYISHSSHKSLAILLRSIILLWTVASKMSRFLANIAQTLRRFFYWLGEPPTTTFHRFWRDLILNLSIIVLHLTYKITLQALTNLEWIHNVSSVIP